MKFTHLGFIMTNKCNAACKICCFSCSPRGNLTLDGGAIKEYLKQAADMGTFKTVGFSGGEAILHFDQLKECTARARDFGFRVTLVTNGFWGRDYAKGLSMMTELVEAGLKSVSFSVDKFHQEFVPVETLINAMNICESLEIFSSATLMDVKSMSSAPEAFRALRSHLYDKDLVLYPVFPAGSGAGAISDDEIIRECEATSAVCPFEPGVTVFFDGSVRMCCSQFSNGISMTDLGAIGKTSLSDAIAAFHDNNFLYVLLKRQFAWFVERAKEFGVSLAEKYSVPCELCHELFTNEAFVRKVEPLVEREAFELRMEKLFT